MLDKLDFYKLTTGKKFNEDFQLPNLEGTVNRIIKQTQSNYPLRLLGISQEGEQYISEEERSVNYHVIGAPGEGKSKFLIYNVIEDIKLGNGFCLLDPTSNGSTVNEILQYCASINHQKVCLIDHKTLYRFNKVACIKPLFGHESNGVIYPDKASIGGVMESIQILFGIKKLTDTARMKRRLGALLRTLIRHNATIYESKYFADYNNPYRFNFLGDDEDSDSLESNFRTQNTFENYFSSTINALDIFWQEPLSLMLAADVGIDFKQMIRDKWVILVNLCPEGNFDSTDSQLLGVLLISQILQAADTLTRNGWKGRYYLYIDEAGRFATKQVDDILSSRRHIGLSLIIAHQYSRQFEDERVLESITQNTGVKVMFNVRQDVDRLKMMKSLGYGGEITPDMASFANQDLPIRYAIIKKNKEKPQRILTPEVHIPDIDTEDYIKSILDKPYYLSREQIKSQINARKLSKNPQSAKPRKAHDSKTAGKAAVPKRQGSDEVSESSKKPSVSPKTRPIKI